jgi:hypothetical protein
MTDEEVKALVERYEMDSGITYELSAQELQVLLAEVGEMEPVIDAINVLNGASVEQRAKDIGCNPEDFGEGEDDDWISVKDLKFWSSVPW